MKVSKVYKYATWALLALNLALIAFFFLLPPPPPHPGPNGDQRGGFQEKNELNLKEDQEALFLESAKKHQESIHSITSAQAETMISYFGSLHPENSSINKDSLLQIIKNLEGDKIEITYKHFEEVKDILNEEQKKNFKDFVDNLLNRSVIKNRRGKR